MLAASNGPRNPAPCPGAPRHGGDLGAGTPGSAGQHLPVTHGTRVVTPDVGFLKNLLESGLSMCFSFIVSKQL